MSPAAKVPVRGGAERSIEFPVVEQPLKAWFHETKHADGKSFSDIKARHRSADLLPGNRVVFNIKGNSYRLIVRIHFNAGIAFIRFIGTHAAYDKIDATTV